MGVKFGVDCHRIVICDGESDPPELSNFVPLGNNVAAMCLSALLESLKEVIGAADDDEG
jgi:hypothetical protein